MLHISSYYMKLIDILKIKISETFFYIPNRYQIVIFVIFLAMDSINNTFTRNKNDFSAYWSDYIIFILLDTVFYQCQ